MSKENNNQETFEKIQRLSPRSNLKISYWLGNRWWNCDWIQSRVSWGPTVFVPWPKEYLGYICLDQHVGRPPRIHNCLRVYDTRILTVGATGSQQFHQMPGFPWGITWKLVLPTTKCIFSASHMWRPRNWIDHTHTHYLMHTSCLSLCVNTTSICN